MNILIVDDQPSVISALKSGVNWTLLGIHQVFTALNALEARQIISAHPIHILLSDIEMPVENGLSLLSWCKQHSYDLECIFLTSHADFFYAQEALQLGCVDYILQPIRYEELQKVIQKTIAKILEKQQQKEYFSYGKALVSSRSSFFKNILHNWFSGIADNLPENLAFFNEIGYSLSPDTEIYLFEFRILSWSEEPQIFSVWSESAQKEISDFFSYYRYTTLSYCPDKFTICVLLYTSFAERIPFPLYKTRLNLLYSRLQEHLHCFAALYSGASMPLNAIADYARLLRQSVADNILLEPGIYFFSSKIAPSISYCDSETLELIYTHLTNYNADSAFTIAKEYLQQLNSKKSLNYQTLLNFCKDFEYKAKQASSFLGLDIHEFPTRKNEFSIDTISPLTFTSALGFIQVIINYFASIKPTTEDPTRCFQRVSNYIHQNLGKPLKCSDIAHAVYLSPDYITKLLQKEKGCSLKEYITQEKMNAAKNLLQNTTLPISAIAVKLGYDNFSHFSQVYKRTMGIAPSEERSHTIK